MPRLIDAYSGPLPLHTSQATKALERWALEQAQNEAGTGSDQSHPLMARAGLAIAKLALAVAPQASSAQVWCGPGHNGGDGLLAAKHLAELGWQVQVLLVGPTIGVPQAAAWALHQAKAASLAIHQLDSTAQEPFAPAWPKADVVLDALLGIGLSRPPQGLMAQAIEHLQRTESAQGTGRPGSTVIAVDCPSGLDLDCGQATGPQQGGAVVSATHTLSLLTLKPGLFTGRGRALCGHIWFDDLGVAATQAGAQDPASLPTAWLAAAPGPWLDGPRQAAPPVVHHLHKGLAGEVLVLGGAPGMEGAARLAARAALASGAGRVSISPVPAGQGDGSPCTPAADTPSSPEARVSWAGADPSWPEIMLAHLAWLPGQMLLDRATVLCGCGGGTQMAAVLPAVLARAPRLVLDADALNAMAHDSNLLEMCRTRRSRRLPTIITPHPLEAARLLGLSTPQVQANRINAAQTLAQALQCTVVLKGSGTLVADSHQGLTVNPTGNAALATAGTGDVLAGWLAGLWAQNIGSHPAALAQQAVWMHGLAADDHRAQRRAGPLRASRLVLALGHMR